MLTEEERMGYLSAGEEIPMDPVIVQPGQNLPPVTPPVAPVVDPKVTALEADLAEQRRMVTNLTSQFQRTQQPTQQSTMDDLNRQFYKEPVTTAAAIAQQAAREIFQQQGQNGHETLIAVAKEQARKRDPELFDKYQTQIQARVNLTDPQFHSNIQVWNSAFDMAMGAHMDEIRDEIRKKSPQAPAIKISQGGPDIPNGQQGQAPKAGGSNLSPEELQMAKNLDISPESYAKGKEDYDNQSDKGKSSWDGLVTFSSKDSRRLKRAQQLAAAKK